MFACDFWHDTLVCDVLLWHKHCCGRDAAGLLPFFFFLVGSQDLFLGFFADGYDAEGTINENEVLNIYQVRHEAQTEEGRKEGKKEGLKARKNGCCKLVMYYLRSGSVRFHFLS